MLQQIFHSVHVHHNASLDWLVVLVSLSGSDSIVTVLVVRFWLRLNAARLVSKCWVNILDFLSDAGRNDTSRQVFAGKTSLDVASAHINDDELFLVESNLHFVQPFLNSAHIQLI